MLFKNYPEGFVINGERRFEKGEGWNMARYIGRYVKHPPIAESRIIAFDGKKVTFWYNPHSRGYEFTQLIFIV
jgi:hypothetical protein